jgi:hypothetical protein
LKNGQKLKLGDAYAPQENVQEVQASKLGDAPEAPLLHRQKSGHLSRNYICIASCIMRFSWSVSCFCFQFSFVLLAAINDLITSCCFAERLTPFFIAKNTLVFTLIVQRVFSFSATAFSFCFCLDFRSDLVLSLFQGVFGPLVYVGFHQKSCFKKVRMVLEKRKKLCKKVVQKGACLDCGLGFCMSCLMSF